MQPGIADTNSDDAAALHYAMVEQLIKAEAIRAPQVEAAFRAVPRHLFLPDVTLDTAYANQAIPTKWIDGESVSAASQPGLVASMLEQLDLLPGQRVLEIGAGTGYNAALLAHIVGDAGAVVSIDIDEDIVASARAHLRAAGFERVQVVCADGRDGYPAAAPYDRIILTVAATEIAPAWPRQLAADGRLVVPLAVAGVMHRSIAFLPDDDHLVSVSAQRCHFMLLRPAAALPAGSARLDPDGELTLQHYDSRIVPIEAIHTLLLGPHRVRSSGVRLTLDEVVHDLGPWLDVREPGSCTVRARGALARQGVVPSLLSGQIGREPECVSAGWWRPGALCLLASSPNRSPTYGGLPFVLDVRAYGDGDALANRLLDLIVAWDKAQRPSLDRATFRVYPASSNYLPAANEGAVSRGAMQMVICWQ